MDGGLEVLCGLSLDGARLTEVEDLAVGQARIGYKVCGPSGLLRDLELRLGLAHVASSQSVRVARWSARLAKLGPLGRFYSRSYEVDAWGTASEILRMRDTLVDAGWDGGAALQNGGERLSQLSELEASGDSPLPPGTGDRLRAVDDALAAGSNPGYVRLRSVEPIALWSHRWQGVFRKLAANGCSLERMEMIQPRADPGSDLGRMQQHLLHGREFVPPRGDGTLLFLRGETVWETAYATAGLLRAWQDEAASGRTVIIRNGNSLPLDLALERAGLPTQGIRSASRLRPLLQVVPLALELAFEPKDPHRVLELLALPAGPFGSIVAQHLAAALAEKPGLGSDAWESAKQRAADLIRNGILSSAGADPGASAAAQADANATRAIEKDMRRVAEWIEAPGHPQAGAPRTALLAAVVRVQDWLRGRIIHAQKDAAENADADVDDTDDAGNHDESLLGIAYGHASSLAETLTADPRTTLGLVQVRQLIAAVVGSGGAIHLRDEQTGRIDHVDSAAALLRSRRTVLWWGCTAAAAEAPRSVPFSRAEQAALAAAGIHLGDARALMAETADGWRRAALAATDRFVLVAPRVECGEAVAHHPFWDELTARMGGERRDLSRVTLAAQDVLHGGSSLAASGSPVGTDESAATPLPPSRSEWRLPAQHLGRGDRASASSLETLLGCPLRWTLQYRAGLRTGSLVSLPQDHRLFGTLGHRLVELLYRAGDFKLRGDALRARALATLDGILPREGATLLLPGRRGELAQVRHQLSNAVLRLADLLQRSKLQIVDVEKVERIDWQGRALEGRLDMLLGNRDGKDVVLDLKWGRTSYADNLKDGTAVQLAVYAYLRKTAAKARAFPAVAYFSLSQGSCLATDDATFEGAKVCAGDDAETTWRKTEVTLKLIEGRLDQGRIPVTGVLGALPLVEECGGDVGSGEHLEMAPDAGCKYCDFQPVCGLRWEAQR